jgi:hypothetical protein
MQTETRTSLVLDLAEIVSGLPPAVAASITGLPGVAPRQNRRLPERILVAAHQACDLGDLDIAAQLLSILETVIGQSRGAIDPARRRVMESLIAAHQRLWHLRHADAAAGSASITMAKPLPGFHEGIDMADFYPPA